MKALRHLQSAIRNLQSRISNLQFAILLLLCAVAVTALFRGQGPCTHDGPLHYYRVAQLRHLVDRGALFTRWLPDLAFGYGYPFFNYREPVSLYLSLALHLTGLPLPWAFNLLYAFSILGCAVGAYLLARDLFGSIGAGLLAGVVYAYAPYQFLDALLRGNLLESIALALFPFILWAFRRFFLEGGRKWFLTSVGLLALLLLTHNISSLLFAPFLGLYLTLLGLVYRSWRRWAVTILAMVLALGLTTFFWLPALAEQDVVQLHMSRVTRNNDFHYNFLGLAEILALPAAVDTALLNPPMEIHLGFAQTVLGGVGLVAGAAWTWGRRLKEAAASAVSTWRERRWSLLFFALSGLIFLFMSTEPSVWLWENVPLLSFAQFPWRFVGRAALPAALLAGALIPAIRNLQSTISNLLLPLCLLFVILTALPSTYPPLGYCPEAPYPTIQDVHRYEHESHLVGVDPEGSYFPIWVEQRPEGSPLEAQYGTGETIARFDETSLPDGASLLATEYGLNRARLAISSPAPFRARYLTFYFPGWRVEIDGTPVEVIPSDPQGLITFDVPPGEHEVTIRFGETPLRLLADAISIVGVLLLLLCALAPLRPCSFASQRPCASAPLRPCSLAPLLPFALAVLALLLLVFKLGVVDRMETAFRRPALSSDGTLPEVSYLLDQPYADGMTLIGFDGDLADMPADGSLRLDLYWTVRQQPSRRYQATIYLVGPEGHRWSPLNSFRPRGYHRPPPTYTWQPGQYAVDSHVIEPLPGTPPGTYRLELVIFDQDTLAPLSVVDAAGQPVAPSLILGEVTLARPGDPADLPTHDRLDLPMAELTLASAEFDREQAAPGDTIAATFLWRADEVPSQAYHLSVDLVGEDHVAAAHYEVPPAVSWYPVTAWHSGDVWLGQHRFTLPADLESGTYTIFAQLSLSPLDSQVPSLAHPVGRITVTAPDHTFTPPPLDLSVDVTLGGVATLLGATFDTEIRNLPSAICNVESAMSNLQLSLIWRAEETPGESYRVFLHLLDAEGRIVSQADGVPANWTRPTTGWIPGEVIVDGRTLDLGGIPSGEYTLSTGLYLPDVGRLTAPDGSDAITLCSVVVEAP